MPRTAALQGCGVALQQVLTVLVQIPGPRATPCPVGPSCCPSVPAAVPTVGSQLCISLCCRCDLCCCLIPCLFDDFKDVTHTCPNCKAYIYTYKRMC